MKLLDYGCPIAVTLLLQFLKEGSVLFLVMCLMASPAAVDAVFRNLRRRECRSLVRMAQPDASQAARLTGCGYDGVALRASLPADSFLSGIHLLPAFGTCEEYAQQPSTCEQFGRASLIFCNVSSTQVISTPAVKPFVPLDSNTDYCMDGDAGLTGSVRFGPTIAFWGMAMNTMLFLMFMLRVRRIQVKQTMASNLSEKKVKEHVYTAADFAAMVTGLDRVVHEPRGADGEVGSYRMPELERRLRDDLAELGFEADAIDHIEIARGCSREMAILSRMATLKAQRQEFFFRLALSHEKTARREAAAAAKAARTSRRSASADRASLKATAREQKQRQALRAKMRSNEAATKKARDELSQLASSDHTTTGDAFIVFQYVADRDRFITMFHPAPVALEDGGLSDICEQIVPRIIRNCFSSCRKACCRTPRAKTATVGQDDADAFGGGNHGGGTGSNSVRRRQRRSERPLLSAASWRPKGVEVFKAPEPTDVYWENLECRRWERLLRMWLTNLVIGLMIVAGTALLYLVQSVQVAANQHFSTYSSSSFETSLQALLISGLAAVVTLVWNLVLKNSVEALTYRERLDTRSHVEVALFTKLIFVYGLNTVAVPLLVSFLTLYDPIEQAPVLHVVGITQAWYESGGAVSRAVILILSSSIVTDLFRYIHIPALINRHILGRFASSQIRLNQLWAPPPMPLGGIYAETFRTLLLGVVYAPIYPPALLLTAFALLSSYLSTRYAISRWYMRPPLVNGSLMKRMRNACEWLALIGAFVTAATGVTAWQGRERHHDILVPQIVPPMAAGFLFCLLLWMLYPLLNRSRYFSTRFKHEARKAEATLLRPVPSAGLLLRGRRSSIGAARGSLRDVRMRYDEVQARCGYAIERYECPAASRAKTTRHLEDTAFRQGFTGGFIDAGNATVLEETSSVHSSSTRDDSGTDHEESDADEPDLNAFFDRFQNKGDDDPFFPPVAPPVAPEDEVNVGEEDSGDKPEASEKEATPPSTPIPVRWKPSKDPVINHLNSALGHLNHVLVELGGEEIFSPNDTRSEWEERHERMLKGSR